MSTTPISSSQYSLTISWQAMLGSSAAAASGGSAQGSAGSCSPAGDSATFSPQALAQLQADQGASAGTGGSAPQLTDSQAAAVGAIIQQTDPSLFAQLDQSGTSQLSASDLQSGIANLLQQLQADAGGGTGGAATATTPAASSSTSSTASLQTIGQAIAQALGHGKGHGHHHGHHSPAPSATTTSASSAASSTTDTSGGAPAST